VDCPGYRLFWRHRGYGKRRIGAFVDKAFLQTSTCYHWQCGENALTR